jgi:hypothetical protein
MAFDWLDFGAQIVSGLFDNASYSKTKNKTAPLRRDDIQWLMDQEKMANRVGHNTPFMSHQWDEDRTTLNTDFTDSDMGRAFQNMIADNFERVGNRSPMAVPHQFGSIQDGLLANKMYRMGILDDESLPNLKQDNYGMRVGDQDRSAYGLDSLTGEEEEDSSLDSILADTVEDEFGNTGTGSRGAGEGGVIDPTAPGSGTDLGGGRDWMDFYRNQNPGGMGGNNQGINDILNDMFNQSGMDSSDPGAFERWLVENADTIGSVLGNVLGLPPGVGNILGQLAQNGYWNDNAWASPNNGPVNHPDSVVGNTPDNDMGMGTSMPGDQGMLDNAINDYIGSNPAPGNSDFYQGGRFNGGAGGTDMGGGMSAGGWGNGIGSAGGLGGGMGGGFGGGFGGMTGNIVGSSWRGTPSPSDNSSSGGGWFKNMQAFVADK